MSWRTWFTGLTRHSGLAIVTCRAPHSGPSFVSSRSSVSRRARRSHWSRSASDAGHQWDFSGFTLLTLIDPAPTNRPLASAAAAATAGYLGLTNGAALALGDDHLLAVGQVVALDLVAEDLAVVTHTDPAAVRLPDVPVGVDLAVCRAAAIISAVRVLTCHNQNLNHGDDQAKENP